MTVTSYRVRWSAQALDMLSAVNDRRRQRSVVRRAESLATDPAIQGKPLVDELSGLRSVRAAGQRYRIIYRVDEGAVTVLVVAVGIRKAGKRRDVYELTRKLLRLGLLDPPDAGQ